MKNEIPERTSKDAELEEKINILNANKARFVRDFSIADRLAAVKDIREKVAKITDEWARADNLARNMDINSTAFDAKVSTAAVLPMLQTLDQYINAFTQMLKTGIPDFFPKLRTRQDGRVIIDAFPLSNTDKLLYGGYHGEIRMQPGISAKDIPNLQARAYQNKNAKGKIALVLGAGNVSSIGMADTLHKLFVDNEVVLFKPHEIKSHMANILEKTCDKLINEGFLQIVSGGDVETAKTLVNHPKIDSIHLTGSVNTFNSIMFGPGETGKKNKAENKPITTKSFGAELGNISPVIIVPGPWTDEEIKFHIALSLQLLIINTGFNCNAPRVFIQNSASPIRQKILAQIKEQLSHTKQAPCYYPGSRERLKNIIQNYSSAETFGETSSEIMPWILIAGLDPNESDHPLFKEEIFGPLTTEVVFDIKDTVEFIDKAVDFCNDKLWGTLSATILVHPKSLADKAVNAAVERAIDNLRYGTVCVNASPRTSYFFGVLPWGGYPGSPLNDIQSGNTFVANPFMLEKIEKSVLRNHGIPISPLTHLNPDIDKFMQSLNTYSKHPNAWNFIKMFSRSIYDVILMKRSR